MKGEKFELTFFRQGFFGYGENGDFRAWGLSHFVALIVTAAGIALLAVFGSRIRGWEGEEQLRCGLIMAVMLCEFGFFWRLSYVGPESHERKTMMMRLPLQVCEWTALISIPMMILRSQILFDTAFYMTMTCGLVPMLLPAVISTTGPRYFRFYQFWGEHVLPIWSVYYMIFVCGFRPRPVGILLEFIILLLMAFPATFFNRRFEDCYYMYLKPEKFPMLKMFTNKGSAVRLMMLYFVVLLLLCLIVQCVLQIVLYYAG